MGIGGKRTIGALAAAFFGVMTSLASAQACDPTKVNVSGDFGEALFHVEVAATEDARSLGLMNRSSMPMMSGMLFIYQADLKVHFWMRNTLIPLDMLFIDNTGTIVSIHENAIPLDETPIPSVHKVRAVLEVNGGMVAKLGIKVGDTIKSPEMPQDLAKNPCE